jgi:hypothetical protein
MLETNKNNQRFAPSSYLTQEQRAKLIEEKFERAVRHIEAMKKISSKSAQNVKTL